jgi:hypothetical protein
MDDSPSSAQFPLLLATRGILSGPLPDGANSFPSCAHSTRPLHAPIVPTLTSIEDDHSRDNVRVFPPCTKVWMSTLAVRLARHPRLYISHAHAPLLTPSTGICGNCTTQVRTINTTVTLDWVPRSKLLHGWDVLARMTWRIISRLGHSVYVRH